MGCWGAEAGLAQAVPSSGGWAGHPTANPARLPALSVSWRWSSALGLSTKKVHHFNLDLKCFSFNLALLFCVKF